MIRRQFCSIILLLLTANALAANPTKFEASEHTVMGDNVKLSFDSTTPGTSGTPLHLPNGIALSYGDILSIGDFYQIIDKPISQGKNEQERKDRFLASFNSFATNSTVSNELKQIVTVINAEHRDIEDAIKQGKKPEETYKQISDEYNRQWNCITGGGCLSATWWMFPGRYLELAKQDFDHFGNNAWITYQTGHTLAVQTALAAHKTHDRRLLEIAYAMNAFACHFLTDRFAAGHIRTPRNELPENTTPSISGTILVNYMHNEENQYGIHVHNTRGDHWLAYGDRAYFNHNNDFGRAIIAEALQLSADEIFSAYRDGIVAHDSNLVNLIPEPDEMGNASKNDIAPLFFWDSKLHILFRRQDTANVYDKNYTDSWWGWSTLLLLKSQRGMSAIQQAQLVRAGFGEQAVRDGLVTDIHLIKKMRASHI